MSELHSETTDATLGLTVRIKLVDLNRTGNSSSNLRSDAQQVSKECLSAFVGRISDKGSRPASWNSTHSKPAGYPSTEICMLTGERIPAVDFETHIETCSICANRVELQLDFMESLEVAVYQRRADPDSQKVRGAMLISAPELNFAVCGEMEIG